jgi:hypothetical protein
MELQDVLDRLDMVVHRVEQMSVPMVKTADAGFVGSQFGLPLERLPLLAVFERGVPIVFPRDADPLDAHEVFALVAEVVERREMPTIDLQVRLNMPVFKVSFSPLH